MVNIEWLNATVHHQFVNKTHEVYGTHITFTPQSRSFEGSLKPRKEEKQRYGFCGINTTLANTIEAIQNAPSAQPKVGRTKVIAIIEKAKTELCTQLDSELKIPKKDIGTAAVTTSNTYKNSHKANLQEVLKQQFKAFSYSIRKALANKRELYALPPLADDQPNMQ